MKNFFSKKRIVFASVIILLIIIAGLYNTYAINVGFNETTTQTYDIALNFELHGDELGQTSINAGKTKIIEIKITNNNSDAIQYGLAYKMITPSTIPSNFTISTYEESPNNPTGIIAAGSSVIVAVKMVNQTSSTVYVRFNVASGYKNGGDLILQTGEEIVPGETQGGGGGASLSPAAETLASLGLTARSETPNFANSSCSSGCDDTLVGVFAAEDDLGTSYYFRGNVTNNYVKFARNEGFKEIFWRIVRINGDGSIRMIYDGASDERNKKYVTTSSGVYTSDLTSITFYNSYAMTDLMSWFSENLYGNGYDEDFVVDAIYCNDTEVLGSESGAYFTGLGAFLMGFDSQRGVTLKCKQIDDRYSRYITVGDIGANGFLFYPIGMLTADEMIMAGVGYNGSNNSTYLSTNDPFWTMTPTLYTMGSEIGQLNMYAYDGGTLAYKASFSASMSGTNDTASIRPVITIRGDSFIDGDGSESDPFVVE